MVTSAAPRLALSAVRDAALFKALVAYTSICWLLLQVTTTFIQGLGLPDWVFTGFLYILAAGFPIVMLGAATSARLKSAATGVQLRLGRLTLRRAAVAGGAVITGWVVLVGLFMASWAFGIGPAASLLASGTLKESDTLLIADFTDKAADPMLASNVTEAIRVDLAQSKPIRVADRQDVAEALKRMNIHRAGLEPRIAEELAVREGMAAVLEGDVSAIGPATLVTARLVDPKTGKTLAEYQEQAKSPADLLDAVDQLGSTLRHKIGEPLTSLRDEPPLAKVTTASMPALRAYTQANDAFAAGKKEQAVALLRSALAQDPTFPMAWRKLGAMLSADEPRAARDAYVNAYRLRGNLPERERGLAEASYFKNVMNNLPFAMQAYRRVLASYPDDETALNNLANLYTALQQPGEALKLQQRLVAQHPRYAAYSNMFDSLVRTGNLEGAERVYERTSKLYPDQKRVQLQPIILAFARGDYAQADNKMDDFLARNGAKPELHNDLFVARYQWKLGRLDQARAIFRERARVAAEKGRNWSAIEAMTSIVAIDASIGRLDDARSALQETLRSYPLDKIEPDLRPYLDLAIASALVGDAASARRYVQLSDAQPWVDETLNYDERKRALGLIAAAEGKVDDALAALDEASHFGQCSTCLLFDIGSVAEAAGRTDQAIAAYRRYVDQAPYALARGEYLGVVLQRLEALERSRGRVDRAQGARAELASLWRRADPGLLATQSNPQSPTAPASHA